MKILIVNDVVIEASKLKLVLARYGTCETAASGKEAIAMFKQAHEASAPYDFINLEMNMEEMKGNQVVEEIRKWETEKEQETKVNVLLVISESDRQTIGASLQEKGVEFLVKPYNRKKMLEVLDRIGLKEAPPPPKKKAAPPPPPVDPETLKKQQQRKKEVDAILKKLTMLIADPDQLQDIESRQMLEALVKEGGKQAVLLLGRFITSSKLPMHTRLELIRSASYIRSPLFLVPLNRVIDSEENIKLVERALVSISKYNDQRALNILNNALKKLKNPMLLNTLRREIAKIKQDNPVLAILPRFLSSHKSLKNFRVTVDILKKIMTPKDTELLINYLRSGNQVIEDGTFELLCYAGSDSIKTSVFNYFDERTGKIPCMDHLQCDELYRLTLHLHYYLRQNPALIDERLSWLETLYSNINDIQTKQLVIAALCRSQKPEALAFIKSIYDQEQKLREWIIEKLSGNPAAVDFLFERYHAGDEFQDKVIPSLLEDEKGLRYFIQHFFTFELEKQELIVKNLPFSNQPFLIDFIRKIYQTELFSLKSYLMKVIREHFLFPFKDILFDPANQREFLFIGKDYLSTIVQLFPLTSLRFFYKKIAYDDISVNKIKNYLEIVKQVASFEPVLHFKDIKFINDLFAKIFKTNNIELNTLFFTTLENIKTLDLRTYRSLREAINTFAQERGANLTQNEKGAVTKVKQRLQDQFPDIREVETLQKELKIIFVNKPIELQLLEKLLKNSHAAVAINIERVCTFLAGRLKMAEYISADDREIFFMQFPLLARFIEYLWSQGIDKQMDWEKIPPRGKLLKHFANELKIVITFKNKKAAAFLKDQLQEIIPEFQIKMDKEKPEENDIILCDTLALQEYLDRKAVSAKHRLYLYLENRMDYAPFRTYSPKAFMKPLSGFRVVKLLLQELYLQK